MGRWAIQYIFVNVGAGIFLGELLAIPTCARRRRRRSRMEWNGRVDGAQQTKNQLLSLQAALDRQGQDQASRTLRASQYWERPVVHHAWRWRLDAEDERGDGRVAFGQASYLTSCRVAIRRTPCRTRGYRASGFARVELKVILHGASLEKVKHVERMFLNLCQSVTEVWKTEAKPSILTTRKQQGMRDKEEKRIITERRTISSQSNTSLAKYRKGVDWPPYNLAK